MNSKFANIPIPFFRNLPSVKSNSIDASAGANLAGIVLERVSVNEWDSMANLFFDIIPEQTGIFNTSHWGDEYIECVKILQYGKLLGGAVLLVRKIPCSPTGLAVLKWGPVWRTDVSNLEIKQYRIVIQALIEEYCTNRNYHLTIMPLAVPEVSDDMCCELKKIGFQTGKSWAAPERYIVNTNQTLDQLMASLNQKWRYNLRKANKNEFKIEFVDDNQGLEKFLSLYDSMIERKQFLDSSAIGSLRKIMNDGAGGVRPKIVLVSHDGVVTAGGVFSIIGDMAVYMFGATDERALALKAGYAMHWWVAEYLCNSKSTIWYDLGGNDLDAGLHQFKKGFVGKTGHILQTPPRYHYAASVTAKFTGNAIFYLRDVKNNATRMLHQIKQKFGK
ncbi:MAG: peptidoglycan bridge formation glycyltransferase FemA/FemB family protein [Rhizobiaceae bacterium]